MRRRCAAALALLVLPALAPAAQAQQGPAAVPAVSAASFVDSVGVCTHFPYTDTSYAQSDALVASLQRLGVRHVRDSLPPRPQPQVLEVLRGLPEAGIGLDLILGVADRAEGQPLPPFPEVWQTFQDSGLADVVEALEGPNEYDLRGGAGYVGPLREFQSQLSAAVQADPALAGVPVVGPSVSRPEKLGQLTGFEGVVDVANIHNYPRGGPPEQRLDVELGSARAVAPDRPLWVTETGYHTALRRQIASPPVPEQAKAGYTTRTLLENFRAGAERTYLYQLVDERPDPTVADQEQHFGLLRSDLSETPAYTALRALLAPLQDPGPAYTPAPLPLEVRGDPAVQHLLLGKRDGTYALVLWRRGLLHEGTRDVAGSARAQVDLGPAARTLTVRGPAGSTDLGPATTVDAVLGDQVSVLEIGARASGGGTVRFDAAAPGAVAQGVPAEGELPRERPLAAVAAGAGLLVVLAAAGALVWRRRRV